jgi:hypothetical protein
MEDMQMRKRLKTYLEYLEAIDFKKLSDDEKTTLKANMLRQIGFFQHERLIHLIVTLAIAFFTILFVFGSMAWEADLMFYLSGILIVLLFFYIRHYYFLENGVQKLYEYYDKFK